MNFFRNRIVAWVISALVVMLSTAYLFVPHFQALADISELDVVNEAVTYNSEEDYVWASLVSNSVNFEFGDFELSIGGEVRVSQVDNRHNDYYGTFVVHVPVTLRNLGNEPNALASRLLHTYTTEGYFLNHPAATFSVIRFDDYNVMQRVPTRATRDALIHLPYTGDGVYAITFGPRHDPEFTLHLHVAKSAGIVEIIIVADEITGPRTRDAEALVGTWLNTDRFEEYVFNADGTGYRSRVAFRWGAGEETLSICNTPNICATYCRMPSRYTFNVFGDELVLLSIPGYVMRIFGRAINVQAAADEEAPVVADVAVNEETGDIVHIVDQTIATDTITVTLSHITFRRGGIFDNADAGMQYIAVNLTIENTSDQRRTPGLSRLYANNVRIPFQARGARGLQSLGSGGIEPGRIVTGYRGHIIPLDTSTLIVEIQTSAGGRETVTFTVEIPQ